MDDQIIPSIDLELEKDLVFWHLTEEMTQTYLESFESSVVDQYDEMIM